jgi:hypothetical protein|tara:strand:+ start:975 stop:1166 length:192 start_codon:yes stop_codon:yes gene_type:complete
MAKKYQMKDDVLPKSKSYLGLGWVNWVSLKNGKVVELDNMPKEAKDFLVEVKDQKKIKPKEVK